MWRYSVSTSTGSDMSGKVRTIGIIGAGFAGLSSAKVLKEFGYEVTVFEKESEVGGVWTSSRRYPGLGTQNVRSTYALSDYPYPKGTQEWPSGEQVQKYIAGYVKKNDLGAHLKLNETIASATQDPATNAWTLTLDSGATHTFDYLIVCNGIFSDPFIPTFDGQDAFLAAGGRICHTTQFNHAEDADGKNIVVVGYGKSSCDVANALVGVAESTTIVARKLIWKVPKKFKNVLNYKMLLLTRMGEALFPYIDRKGFEKFIHGRGKAVSKSMVGSVQSVITSQFKLNELNLHPHTGLDTIVRSTVSLASDGFFDKVKSGVLVVERDASVIRMEPGFVHLSNGKKLPADIVICGTGFYQRIPFFSSDLQAKVTDERGNFRLYRQMLPLNVRNLMFNGYNSSFLSQLNAEMGALWIAAYLSGGLNLPSETEMNHHMNARLAWMEERTEGKHAKGTNIIPFSMHNVDELLSDLHLSVGPLIHAKEWLLPIDPRNYAKFTPQLRKRLAR
jgi:dimethylaniline monooxygenase (N-oxide forming)